MSSTTVDSQWQEKYEREHLELQQLTEQMLVVEKERAPIYKKWWFWTAIAGGVLVVGAVTAGIVVATRPSVSAPERMLPGNVLTF